jgi:hypothetical protein
MGGRKQWKNVRKITKSEKNYKGRRQILTCLDWGRRNFFLAFLVGTSPSNKGTVLHVSFHSFNHGRMNYKDTKPYMSSFLSVDLLTDFAAFCSTDFIDRRYIHSWFEFSTQLVNCCPHGRRNYTLLVYCCPSTVPSL